MLKNYLLAAYRNLVKNKLHSLINIVGLSVGMAVAMLIGFWIVDEWTFDKNFANYDRLAVVWQHTTENGGISTGNNTPFPLGEELRDHYGSDFAHVAMTGGTYSHILSIDDKKLSMTGAYMEPVVGDMLSLDMVYGSRAGLVGNPDAVLLSQKVAKAYFGNDNPMGKVMRIDNRGDVKVVGVYKDFPQNSSFSNLGFIASWAQLVRLDNFNKRTNPWRSNSYETLVQLIPGVDPGVVSQKIELAKLRKVHPDEIIHHGVLFLHPMRDWHLRSDFQNGKPAGGRIQFVWMFGIIGLFVLLLACINFMNLSTARSEKRAKEVGVRKAIGSLRGQLIWQFMGESVLVVFLALLLALVLAVLGLPFFNSVADKTMAIPWSNPLFWMILLSFSVLTGLIAGSYPAFYLSAFRPVKVLKGSFRVGRLAALPRKVLVVVQFTVSVVLIIGTIVVFRQIRYAEDRPVGYEPNRLVMVPMYTDDIHKHFDAIQDELIKAGVITGMAEATSPTNQVWSTNSGFEWTGKDPGQGVDFPNIEVSPEYGKTVGWSFSSGRDFVKGDRSDSAAFVVNESAVKFMGLKDPVGQIVKWDDHPYRLIGVIKDMIMESPYSPVRPTFYHLAKGSCDFVLLRIDPTVGMHKALETIEPIFKQYSPAQPFDAQFSDEEYTRKFGDEQRVGTLTGFFSALAIFISCLGLFGMASFTAEQRIKEIGIRKVLGASIVNLWGLLSRDFLMLTGISLLISLPLSFYLMNGWLDKYAYRTSLTWWIFAAAAVGAMGITLVTVSFQAIKAALANPTRSLKTE